MQIQGDPALNYMSKKCNIQFFAGLAFSGAFISALFPFPGLTLAFYLPFLFSLALSGLSFNSLKITKAILLLGFVSLYYIFWLAISPGSRELGLIVRLVYFYALAFAFVFGRSVEDPREFMRGFWKALLPLSVVSSAIGVTKVAFQSRGYILGPLEFFYSMAGASYPYGSSLIADYNIYAASLMVAMVGFIIRISLPKGRIDWWSIAAVAVILLSLYMCGSRRSYVLLIALYACLCLFVILRGNRKTVLRFFVVTSLMFLMVYLLSDALSSSLGKGRYEIIFPIGTLLDSLGKFTEISVFTYRPQDLVSSISPDQSFGLSNRLVRWDFAIKLLAQGNWLLGDGFSYQDKYSCRFMGCGSIDYPHNIFLSEWLLSGVFGISAMVYLFFMIFSEMMRFRKKFIDSGVLLILLVVLPGCLISGDGVFSVPQILAAIMMAFIFSFEESGSNAQI